MKTKTKKQNKTLCAPSQKLLASVRRGETSGVIAAIASGDVETLRAVLSIPSQTAPSWTEHALALAILEALPQPDALAILDGLTKNAPGALAPKLTADYLVSAEASAATPRLRALLSSHYDALQHAAAVALALRGDDVAPLIAWATRELDPAFAQPPEFIASSIKTLACIAHPDADALTLRALNADKPDALWAALDGLSARLTKIPPALAQAVLRLREVGDAHPAAASYNLQALTMGALGAFFTEEARAMILDACRGDDDGERLIAYGALAHCGDAASLLTLLKERLTASPEAPDALDDFDQDIEGIIEALSAFPEALAPMRAEPFKLPVAMRYALLRHAADETDAPFILESLKRGGALARTAAAEAAGRARLTSAVPLLLPLLDAQHEDHLRFRVIEALAAIADHRALAPLQALVASPTDDMAVNAACTLAEFGWTPGPEEPEARAVFLAASRDWGRCLALGDVALPAITRALPDHGAASGSLVSAMWRAHQQRPNRAAVLHLRDALYRGLARSRIASTRAEAAALLLSTGGDADPRDDIERALLFSAQGDFAACLVLGAAGRVALLSWRNTLFSAAEAATKRALGEALAALPAT